jgi:hypothetical protein
VLGGQARLGHALPVHVPGGYITDPRIAGHEASAILEGNAAALFGGAVQA